MLFMFAGDTINSPINLNLARTKKIIKLKGNLITLEPLDVKKHTRGYFEVSQDENIHRYTGNSVPKDINEIEMLYCSACGLERKEKF